MQLAQYLDALMAQHRQKGTMLEEMTSILIEQEAADDQFIGRLAGLGRFAQQESRPLQAHEPVRHVPYTNPAPIAPPQTVDANPNPNVVQRQAQYVQHPAQPPRQAPPPSPVSQHPVPTASSALRQLLARADEAVQQFRPAQPPAVPQRQRRKA